MAKKDRNNNAPDKCCKSWSIIRVRQIRALRTDTRQCLFPAPLSGQCLDPVRNKIEWYIYVNFLNSNDTTWHWGKFPTPEHGCRQAPIQSPCMYNISYARVLAHTTLVVCARGMWLVQKNTISSIPRQLHHVLYSVPRASSRCSTP